MPRTRSSSRSLSLVPSENEGFGNLQETLFVRNLDTYEPGESLNNSFNNGSPNRSLRDEASDNGDRDDDDDDDDDRDDDDEGSVTCLICLCRIRQEQAIWQCRDGCFVQLHLSCIKDWAASQLRAAAVKATTQLRSFPAEAVAAGAQAAASWGCPKCRKPRPSAEAPTRYTCFCGKVPDPPFDPWILPHSCGELCGQRLARALPAHVKSTVEDGMRPRPRPDRTSGVVVPVYSPSSASACPHTCMQLCHPGPCPPCPQIVDASCFCGKVRGEKRRCGYDEAFACGSICGKLLYVSPPLVSSPGDGPLNATATAMATTPVPCGHRCPDPCHAGPCRPCTAVVEGPVSCRCGLETRTRVSCFDARDSGGFRCTVVCGKPLACGHHFCALVCHAGPCEACPRLGQEIRCPCGKVCRGRVGGDPVDDVIHYPEGVDFVGGRGAGARAGESDSDGVGLPTRVDMVVLSCVDTARPCKDTCGRLLPCGLHTCRERCHVGECVDRAMQCKAHVRKTCRCGKFQKLVPCHQELLCDSRCSLLRSCGRHVCRRRCCGGGGATEVSSPFTADAAALPGTGGACPPCREICGLKLQCGQHRCSSACHSGPCIPCPLSSVVACACGSSQIEVLCGSRPPARPPPCRKLCGIQASCRHAVLARMEIRDGEDARKEEEEGSEERRKGNADLGEIPGARSQGINEATTLARGDAAALAMRKKPPVAASAATDTGATETEMARRTWQHLCHFGPCPPCAQPCGSMLPCGHTCPSRVCHDPVPCSVQDFNGALEIFLSGVGGGGGGGSSNIRDVGSSSALSTPASSSRAQRESARHWAKLGSEHKPQERKARDERDEARVTANQKEGPSASNGEQLVRTKPSHTPEVIFASAREAERAAARRDSEMRAAVHRELKKLLDADADSLQTCTVKSDDGNSKTNDGGCRLTYSELLRRAADATGLWCCPPCETLVTLTCLGGHTTQDMPCCEASKLPNRSFACNKPCGQKLACGNHLCSLQCHAVCSGGAPEADLPDYTTPCEPCTRPCNRPRPCGHACPLLCHMGPCPPCDSTFSAVCHCERNRLSLACRDVSDIAGEAAVRRSGGSPVMSVEALRNEIRDFNHPLSALLSCKQTCGKRLPWCPHTCQLSCHPGECPAAFDPSLCQQDVLVTCSCAKRRQRATWACAEAQRTLAAAGKSFEASSQKQPSSNPAGVGAGSSSLPPIVTLRLLPCMPECSGGPPGGFTKIVLAADDLALSQAPSQTSSTTKNRKGAGDLSVSASTAIAARERRLELNKTVLGPSPCDKGKATSGGVGLSSKAGAGDRAQRNAAPLSCMRGMFLSLGLPKINLHYVTGLAVVLFFVVALVALFMNLPSRG